MLSRLAFSAAQANRNGVCVYIRGISTTVAKADADVARAGERDLVNFPRVQRLMEPPKQRFVFIPDKFFQSFYKKTGVTGPYMFGITFGAFLLSKEYLIWNAELNVGIILALFIGYLVRKYGPGFTAYLDKEIEKDRNALVSFRVDSVNNLKEVIEQEKKEQAGGDAQKHLYEAKRENVGLQLEAEYRRRMLRLHGETKRRLDFHAEIDSVKKNLEQKHMVDWIVKQVKSAITPEQEKQALQSCIARIKQLAAA